MNPVIAPDCLLGEGATIEPFCILGVEPLSVDGPVTIGSSARIRSHSVIYRGTSIGDHFHAGHGVLIREATSIGDHVSVGSHSVVEHHVRMADHVRLHSRCFVPEHSVIHEGAWLGPGVILTNAKYPNRPDTKDTLAGVTVGPGAVIGAGAVLLPGISIGESAIIGAGAVVVRDVDSGATVVGNPARTVS